MRLLAIAPFSQLLEWCFDCPNPKEFVVFLVILQVFFIKLLKDSGTMKRDYRNGGGDGGTKNFGVGFVGTRGSITNTNGKGGNNGENNNSGFDTRNSNVWNSHYSPERKPNHLGGVGGVSPGFLTTPVKGNISRQNLTSPDLTTKTLLRNFAPFSGNLKKKSTKVLSGWQTRYFVIDSQYIKYYKDKVDTTNSENILGGIDIRQLSNVNLDKKNAHVFQFTLNDHSRVYQLKSSSADNAAAWVEELQERKRVLLGDMVDSGRSLPIPSLRMKTSTTFRSDGELVNLGNHGKDNRTASNFEGFESPRGSEFSSSPGRKNSRHGSVMSNVGAVDTSLFSSNGGKTNNLSIDNSITGKYALREWEIICVKQLKNTFPSIDAATLVRFNRACKGNVQDTIDRLIEHIKWRSETFPIDYESVKEDCKRGKYILLGRDKEGDVVIYIQGHELGPHTYTTIEDHMNSVFFLLEIVASELLDDPLDKFTIVYNRMMVEKKNRDLKWAENIGKTLNNHYPERMKRAYVIPANIVFRSIWSVVKLFFDPDTASKIAFMSGPNDLLKVIDKEQLPPALGGTLEYKFDPNHLFTKEMPGITRIVRDFNNTKVFSAAQKVYELPSHFTQDNTL